MFLIRENDDRLCLTPSATRCLLHALGRHPNKRLGQHFLIDPNIVRKSLLFADVAAGEPIIEIGAGLGALTLALLEVGALVYAVEYDPFLAKYLRRTLMPVYGERFRLCEANALKQPLGLWPSEETANDVPTFKIVSNLPYAIVTPWLDAVLSEPGFLPECMALMVQREAAQRLTASVGSKDYSAIAVALAAAYDKGPVHRVSRHCFYPKPQVDSVLLTLHLRADHFSFKAAARRLIRTFFIHRRKQIQVLCRQQSATYPFIEDWLKDDVLAAGIPPTARPESIPLGCWKQLDSRFPKKTIKSQKCS